MNTKVRAHYEAYPYPHRNPEETKAKPVVTYGDALDYVNHYCFEGKQDFNNAFRVLVAGGGTGDGTLFWAEQLRHKNAEVVYLDFSTSSMNIAKKRAEDHGLSNIKWINGSLLDVKSMEIGEFDFISCTGVLHHLPDPDAGLAALRSVLKESGAMMIMLYGQYGRTGLYQAQEMLRIINVGDDDMKSQLNTCKALLNDLPEHHWLRRGGFHPKDIPHYGDVELYDAFLHSQDRAYTVPQLYEFVEKAGLHLQEFIGYNAKILYSPSYYIKDRLIQEKVTKLPLRQQQALSELYASHMNKHHFYVTTAPRPVPSPENMDMIPSISLAARHRTPSIEDTLRNMPLNTNITFKSNNIPINFKTPSIPIFKYLDGKRRLREIFECIQKSDVPKLTEAQFIQSFIQVYAPLHLVDCLLLHDKPL